MKQIDYVEQQSKVIDWLRFPLIVCVVFIHYTPNYDIGPIVQAAKFEVMHMGSDYFFLLIKTMAQSVFPRIAVPMFFVISGYLFFFNIDKWKHIVFVKKIRKRIRTLLLPYLLWNVIAISYPLSLYLFRDVPMPDNVIDWLAYFWSTDEKMNYPLDYPLWYVRDLIIMSLMAPLWWFLINRLKLIAIIIFLFLYVLQLYPHITGMSPQAITFFNIGAYLSINHKNIIQTFKKIELTNYVITLCLLLICVFLYQKDYYNNLISLYTISGVISTFNIASHLVEKDILKINYTLKKYVFFIYSTHTLVFVFVMDIIAHTLVGDKPIIVQLPIYFIMPYLKILTCIMFYLLMKRYIPCVLKILVGNRN